MFTRKMQPARSAQLILVLIWLITLLPTGKLATQAQSVPQSQAKYTGNMPDLNKRSVIEIDPTTLALNITIPLGSYPGRNGGLPVTLHYNSKLWRVQPYTCSDQMSNPIVRTEKHTIHYETGWTSSLQVPSIDYNGADERYIVRFRDGVTYYGPDHGQPAGRCPAVNLLTCDDGCYAYPLFYYVDRLRLKMPGGSSHELRAGDSATTNPVGPIYKAVDGSGIIYDRGIQTAYLPDGSQYRLNTASGAEYVDRNGNKLVWNRDAQRWTDTLGRIFVDPLDGSPKWKYLGQGASEFEYKFIRGSLRDDNTGQTLLTNPQNPADPLPWNPGVGHNPLLYAAPQSEFNNQYLGGSLFSLGSNEDNHNNFLVQFGPNRHNPYLIHQIVFPNNQKYIFTYNIYGEIDKVILPTGGYKRYRYDYVPPSMFATTPDMYTQTNRGVVEMWESEKGDGTDEKHWRFTESVNGEVIFKTLAPDGTYVIKDIYQSAPPDRSFGFSVAGDDARAGRINRETSYDAAGNKLSMKVYGWVYDNTGPSTPPYVSSGQPIGIQQSSRNPRLAAETEYLYKADGNMVVRRVNYQHDADLNVTAIIQYADVTVTQGTTQLPPPVPLRTVETTYLVNDPDIPQPVQAEYRRRNLIRLATKNLIKDHTTNSAGVVVAGTQMVYDEYAPEQYNSVTSWEFPRINAYDRSTTAYGNVTTVRRWQDYTYNATGVGTRQSWGGWNTGTWLSTHTWYDQCGNIVKVKDANNNETVTRYEDSFLNHQPQNSYAYPTKVTTAGPALETLTKYDFHTGLVMEVTDPNGSKTRNEYNDPFNRLTKIIAAEGATVQSQTVIQYEDAARRIITTSDKDNSGESASGNGLRSVAFYDGYGRTTRNVTYEGNNNWSATDTAYDALHRVAQVSNPYRITATNVNNLPGAADAAGKVWTTTQYDALSRITAVTTPDNAVVRTAYDGTRVLVTDQAGKQRLSQSNALGHLTDVWEIISADGATESITTFPGYPAVTAGYRTGYKYDALDNLISVTQANASTNTTQTRSFVYDSLARLVTAINPESGQTIYLYDENGNLRFKRDARAALTEIIYDALNRPIAKLYSGTAANVTPAVNFYYDHNQTPPSGLPANFNRGSAKGRLVAVIYDEAGSGSYYGYDELGRTKQSVQRTMGQDYSFNYAYNRAGQMTSEIYPSGRVVTTSYDTAGRLSLVRGERTGEPTRDYASQFSYWPHGAVEKLRLDNGLWEHTQFNARLQVTQIGLGTSGSDTSKLKLFYEYGGTDNNGNVRTQQITPGAGQAALVQNYTYDALNRLKTATEVNSWAQTYDYDRYGNRVVQEGSYFPRWDLTPKDLIANVDAATNRLREPYWQYDAAGNQTRDAGWQNFAYDAENRLLSVSNDQGGVYARYSYDGEGRRVQKEAGGVTTVFVYNAVGQLIAEYANTAAGTGGIKYLTADTLGNTRLVTSDSGEVKARYDYLPFGEEIEVGIGGRGGVVGYNTGETLRQKFGAKERDTETGLDYFGARYNSNAQGRFISPDWSETPEPVPYADLTDPQSLNLYAYVCNNPLSMSDPDGHSPDWWQRLLNGLSGRGFQTDAEIERVKQQAQTKLNREAYEASQWLVNERGADPQQLLQLSNQQIIDIRDTLQRGSSSVDSGGITITILTIGPRKPDLNFSAQQLQKKFKHAADFGVKGNANGANLVKFREAIERHVADPATHMINGTYRGQPVTHHVNPTTGVNVIKDAAGNFLSGWKLNPAQLHNVLTRGSL